MGRAWRIEYEGALYHLMSRGNDGQHIYLNDADRNLFLETISEMPERFKVDIFAYVLMTNNYHLLVRTNRANLKKAMQWFGTTYTRRFNNQNLKKGHLFQYYTVEEDAVHIYLTKPDARAVYFASSLDTFEPIKAKKNGEETWEVTVPKDIEFRYFYIVDGVVYVPLCTFKEYDDFGSENCIYVLSM